VSPVRAAGSVADALGASVDALAAAGVDSPRLDAELMLAEAVGSDRARLIAEPEAAIDPPAARAFGAMVRRRLRREPVAYILGRRWFRDLELRVDSRALIPRPETELLVEVAVALRPASVLEVGTGSGAVALAVAAELPSAEVTATDSSPGALALAGENATRLGLAGRVRFAEGTLPEGASFDLLVANLPYVGEDEWPELAPEIAR
jgi:release factor glutamine methyltransferase